MIIVDNKRWNKIVENQIKFIDVAKEGMHRWMMKNVHKIKIKLENIWIDLIMGIYAPYTALPLLHFNSDPLLWFTSVLFLSHIWPISVCPCFPLISLSCPCLPVSLISVPKLPWSPCLLNIITYPVPSPLCFMIVPFFLVPDWVKLNLQCRVS